jgi:hypothetical protein
MEENNSQEELRKKIDEAFDQLDWFIEKMPLNEEGKKYIWQHSFTQFYESYWSSETGEITYGIQTEWQLDCFKEKFKENFKQLRIKRMEAFSAELDNLPPITAKDRINKQLRGLKRKRLLAEIGGATPTDWDDWLQKYLLEEKFSAEERTDSPKLLQKQSEQEQPNTFEELFHDETLVQPCIEILKEVDPPLIDAEGNFIAKLKGAFCVWVDEMQRQGIMKHCSDRKLLAALLPQKIKGFSIDESMFGRHHQRAEDQYRITIKTMLSRIRLSQNSH